MPLPAAFRMLHPATAQPVPTACAVVGAPVTVAAGGRAFTGTVQSTAGTAADATFTVHMDELMPLTARNAAVQNGRAVLGVVVQAAP